MSTDSTTNGIKAIETRYAGCHFRSRLEARWAVFFDALGIRWEYEPQGYTGEFGDNYLPDFLLPDISPAARSSRMSEGDPPPCLGTFVEVKGSDEQLHTDSSKIGECIDYKSTPIAHGLLILGPVPRVELDQHASVGHSFLSWHKGVDHCVVGFNVRPSPPIDPTTGRSVLGGMVAASPVTRLATLPIESAWWSGNTSQAVPEQATVEALVRDRMKLTSASKVMIEPRISSTLASAYVAARSARFEHGQSGAT